MAKRICGNCGKPLTGCLCRFPKQNGVYYCCAACMSAKLKPQKK